MNYDGTKCFFHVDLDAFFASVEQLVHPEWKGKPVVVGGVPGDRRAVVSTASYEARKFGIHSAMPLVRAVELCPNAIFVRGNHKLYSEYSEKIMAIFNNYSPDVKQISIDEAFLDLTGTGRLFGDPIDTARRLKAEVFEKTGLTVSVGIATSNYVAKICSGLKKPDGLYAVLPDKEEDFMLNLPLEKVWGIGQKTLERLKAAGFNSTRDIHNHSQKLLESIFGVAQAEFLYSVVRGIDPPGFLEEAKTHSAGIETTFDYDLTEWDAIEAALLALSEQLMFRLLRDNITGKTLVVKIRYEDFTTVTARETSTQNITSVDDLYCRAKKIFRKKYEAGCGIRLLGLTVGNTQSADKEMQNELFDFGEGKRRAIEKSILKIEQKNPDIKIHKARLLNSSSKIIAAFFLATLFAFAKPAFAEKTNVLDASGSSPMVVGKVLPPETIPKGSTLFDLDVNDNRIKFEALGWWNALLSETVTMNFGFGNDFSISAAIPVFKQEIDLSLDFTLDEKWFLQAAFADKFATNTLAIGYKNGGNYVRDVRISNRLINFPSTYSVNDIGRGIGGGKNQAPGISASFGSPDGKWTLDTAVRYDMLVQRDKTYYGKNSVNDTDRNKASFITGRMYVLPSAQSATAISEVYVEHNSGSYRDAAGKKYKKLSSSEYLIVPSRKMIVLSNEAGASKKNSILPAVAIAFNDGGIAQIQSELGTYGTAAAPGTGFLGDVQKEFGAELNSGIPNVAAFSYGGTQTEGFFGRIAGSEVLYIQHPAGFSPFTVAFRYDFGTSKIDEVSVVHIQSGKAAARYAAIQADDDLRITEKNYFLTEHFYADAYDTETSSNDYADPVIRFPFCRSSPGTYLGYEEGDDTVLRARNYTPVNRFDIGTNAVAGTIMVYKNAVLDSGAQYNPESGEVTLSSAVNTTDKIYIVWSEDSSSFKAGAIAGAVGFNYNITENLSADVSAATRWSIAPFSKYADSLNAASGYATIASRIKYETESLNIGNTISGTVENPNTKGLYKILGMEDAASKTTYLGNKAAKSLPANFAPRLNARPEQPPTSAIELLPQDNRSQKTESGIKEEGLTGYKIPVSFSFTGDSSEWAAQTIEIAGAALTSASAFKFFLKAEDALPDVDIYLQLGVNSEENFSYESKAAIATWKISSADGTIPDDLIDDGEFSKFDTQKIGWQKIGVILKDVDRAHCSAYDSARLIIVNKGASNSTGTIYFGPYEISSQGIFTQQDEAFTIIATQIPQSAVSGTAKKLNKDTNYAQEISWLSTESSAPSDTQITMYKYFKEVGISDYSEINMLFKYEFTDTTPLPCDNDKSALLFLLDTEAAQTSGEGKIAARAEIMQNAIKDLGDGKWHTLTIQTGKRRVEIDGTPLPASDYRLRLNTDNLPTRAKIVFNTCGADGWHKRGYFCIDEIYLSETSARFVLEDKNFVHYKMPNAVVVGNNYELFKNLEVRASSREFLTFYTQENHSKKFDISADAGLKFTFADINFSAEAARTTDSDHIVSAAAHSISTDKPIFKVIDFLEEFNYDAENNGAAKRNFAKLDFSSLNVPLVLDASWKVDSTEWSVTSDTQKSADFSAGKNGFLYTFHFKADTSQKTLANYSSPIKTANYFYSWLDASKKEFQFGDPLASKRKIGSEIKNTLRLPWTSLAPQLNFSSEESYTVSKCVYYSDKSNFEFVVPFKIKKNTLSFSWNKKTGGTAPTTQGGGYSSDIKELCSALGKRGYYFASPIFYDLFNPKLKDKVTNGVLPQGIEGMDSEYYTGEYSLNFSRPIFADKYDIIVPSSAALSVARDIRAAETLSDTYQTKLKLGWTAINIFGRDGALPIAKWFEQDEYISSFIATLKFPRTKPSVLTQVYTTYLQANFYITNDNVLKNGIQFEFQDKKNFSAKLTMLWQRPGKYSPILSIAKLFSKKFNPSSVPLIRNDSINFQWRKSDSGETQKFYQAYEFSHSVDYKISKYVSLNTGIDLGFECTWNDICTLTATFNLGGKLLF